MSGNLLFRCPKADLLLVRQFKNDEELEACRGSTARFLGARGAVRGRTGSARLTCFQLRPAVAAAGRRSSVDKTLVNSIVTA
jgi:hypothetical protein